MRSSAIILEGDMLQYTPFTITSVFFLFTHSLSFAGEFNMPKDWFPFHCRCQLKEPWRTVDFIPNQAQHSGAINGLASYGCFVYSVGRIDSTWAVRRSSDRGETWEF